MVPTAQTLRRVALFAGLSDDALARVASVAFRRSYDAGETIIFEGDPCRAAYFIAEGQVRVYRLSPGGREQVLARLGPGQAFNTLGITRDQPGAVQSVRHLRRRMPHRGRGDGAGGAVHRPAGRLHLLYPMRGHLPPAGHHLHLRDRLGGIESKLGV
jgi:hypothetical protein